VARVAERRRDLAAELGSAAERESGGPAGLAQEGARQQSLWQVLYGIGLPVFGEFRRALRGGSRRLPLPQSNGKTEFKIQDAKDPRFRSKVEFYVRHGRFRPERDAILRQET